MYPDIGKEKIFTIESELAGLIHGIHRPRTTRFPLQQPAYLHWSNSLVYRFYTAVLAVVYFGSVIMLQGFFRQWIGPLGQSQAVIFVSTLCAAALLSPLRRWVQKTIDRRFFRQNYNAELTLQAFSAAVHDEVDLDQLNIDLVNLVEETIQPSSISLWINEPKS